MQQNNKIQRFKQLCRLFAREEVGEIIAVNEPGCLWYRNGI